tara:strand:- start:3069 stop:3422 length:354 start_codon:yes stop_codon:yes gene_type:complete
MGFTNFFSPYEDNGLRVDGTPKGMGYFGELSLTGGGVATEYSEGVNLGGKELEIPMLVPTLDKQELYEMINDIIPNNKPAPNSVFEKALQHAESRISKGLSPFATEEDSLINIWNNE